MDFLPPHPPSYCHFGSSGIKYCFSSLHNSQGRRNWRDDVRAGADETARVSDRAKYTMKDGVDRAKERTRATADAVADMAREAPAKAVETGLLGLGEKAKQRMYIDCMGMLLRRLPRMSKVSWLAIDIMMLKPKGRTPHEPNAPTDSDVGRLRKRVPGHDLQH